MNRRGFTLLETLVVLAILGMVLSASYVLLRPMLERSRLDNATAQVATDLLRVRSYARRSNQPASWTRLDDRRYRLDLGGKTYEYTLPEGVTFAAPPAGTVLRYYPPYGEFDASAETITLQDARGNSESIHVVGVTGKVIRP
ncbi:pilus assembly FimT family protein [Oceanithermus sp.]